MSRRIFIASALCAAATVAGAQQAPLDITVREVQGLVTVSNGSTIANVVQGAHYKEGSHFVTGASSGARLVLSSGCVLRMSPSQAITVTADRTCDELLALLRTSSTGLAAVAPGAGVATGSAALSSVIFVSSALAARESVDRKATVATGGSNGGAGGGIPNLPVSGQ